MWNDECVLLKSVETINKKFNIPEYTTVEIPVYCNVKSVKCSEFYKAHVSGYKAEKVFEVKKVDFDEDCDRLVYEEKIFYIIRTYEVDNENIELTCSSKLNNNESKD